MKSLEKAFKKLTKLKENLKDLTYEEAYEIFKSILEGNFSEIKTSAFLTAMRIKGETPEELKGIRDAVREFMNFPQEKVNALDLAINYDGKNRTVYILPSALWIASHFGLKFTNHFALKTPTKEGITLYEVCNALSKELNVSFSNQKDYCPALYKLMPLRKELGFRTLINTVEKLLNPFNTKRVIVSVFHKPYFEKYEEFLNLLEFEDYTIIKGLEGGIEPFTDRPTLIKRKGKEIEEINPEDLDIELPESVSSQNVLKDSVEINEKIIKGEERGKFFNWAVYTASILLYCGGKVESVEEGIKEIMARFLQ